MALSFSKTNKLFFALGIIFELWFILMYALEYYYLYPVIGTIFQELAYTFNNFQGFLLVLFLLLLFFLGNYIRLLRILTGHHLCFRLRIFLDIIRLHDLSFYRPILLYH
jgi:hypothetical protein